MDITIIWHNCFPGDGRDLAITKEMSEIDPFTTQTSDIETMGVLDTPAGYYLHEIQFPGITFRYNRNGQKEIITRLNSKHFN